MKLRLNYWRRRRVMSIPELAQKAKSSNITIIRIERDGRVPRPNVIRRLAEALDITTDQLLVMDEDEEESLQKAS